MKTRIKELREAIKVPLTSDDFVRIERILREARATQGYSNRIFGDIQKIIEQNRGKSGALIRVLQQAQNLVGYLPNPVIKIISRELKVNLSEIYGVISFYHFFSMVPKGKHTIQVCMGTSCYVKGGQLLLDSMKKNINLEPGAITSDGRYSLEIVRCLGACGLSPVMAIGKDVYGRIKANKVSEILDTYD